VLISDFDGVIIDGMDEYWWSARRCAIRLDPRLGTLPAAVPEMFRTLRPHVLGGWEMPLLAASIGGLGPSPQAFGAAYGPSLQQALGDLGWDRSAVEAALDEVRTDAVRNARQAWVALHRPYPWMLAFLQRLQAEGTPWRVLTTKSAAFTAELLASHGLEPEEVHGREDGPKPAVLAGLLPSLPPQATLPFLEDRLASLLEVQQHPDLRPVRGFLASWGYLLPGDIDRTPATITVLRPEDLQAPLANW
jgi:phosphoglycolate phosphatase-like HAD superfamily hydrolase